MEQILKVPEVTPLIYKSVYKAMCSEMLPIGGTYLYEPVRAAGCGIWSNSNSPPSLSMFQKSKTFLKDERISPIQHQEKMFLQRQDYIFKKHSPRIFIYMFDKNEIFRPFILLFHLQLSIGKDTQNECQSPILLWFQMWGYTVNNHAYVTSSWKKKFWSIIVTSKTNAKIYLKRFLCLSF